MSTIKSFLASTDLQLDMVLMTGLPSSALVRKLEGFGNRKSVEKALVDQGISFDIKITEFKIRAIQELVGWAVSVENFLKISLYEVEELLKHKHSDTSLHKFVPSKSGAVSKEPVTTLTVGTTRILIDQIKEINLAYADWQWSSVKELQQIFNQEVFKGVTLSLGDYIELGAPKKPIYRSVMNEIVQQLSTTDVGDWRMPWRVDGTLALPRNVVSSKCYSGFNILWLWQVAQSKRYPTQIWGTRYQWTQLDATIQPGEVATPVFKIFSIGGRGETDFRMAIVPLYNAAQVQGWVPKTRRNSNVDPVHKAECFVKQVNPEIREHSHASFNPKDDYIYMPPPRLFDSTEGYYGTLLHELIHWSGHESRENREFDKFGSPIYAKEELIAELGAAFLCAELGVVNRLPLDHARYVDSWIKDIRKKHRTLIWAAAKASQAIDCLKSFG